MWIKNKHKTDASRSFTLMLVHPLIPHQLKRSRAHKEYESMSGEMLNAAVLSFSLIFIGIGLGFLLLKIQGVEE